MITLTKGISSGTTALVHYGEITEDQLPAALLDPVRGLGADLFVTISDRVRAYTLRGEITPPSAAIRLAAAYLHARTPEHSSWELIVDGHGVQVSFEAGEYGINHGQWSIPGGEAARVSGQDRTLALAGIENSRPGLGVSIGGRTVAVTALMSAEELASLDLTIPPEQSEAAEHVCALIILGEREVDLTDSAGQVVGTQSVGALQARAYDALAGEVYSGDTIAIAGAAAAQAWLGEGSAREWIAVFAGGNTRVLLGQDATAWAGAELFAEISYTPAS